jgi:hypothetical protein
MTRDEAIAAYPVTCAAVQLKGRWHRNGNPLPTSQQLRYADCKEASVTVVEDKHSTILKIEPTELEVPPGKSGGKRSAFYLLVT